jgi:amino acid transporter
MLLMAAGGSIGAGLFVGSGQALKVGGPGSLVLNFAISGLMVCLTMASLGEMATSYPVAGAFYDYSVRFISSQWGFAMGWNFVFNWLIVLPFELTTIGAQLRYWDDSIKSWYIIIPFIIFLAVISFNGAKWFGELEHWFGLCKAVAISTFICVAIGLVTAGLPGDPRGALQDRYWQHPGAFLNGFQGFLAVFRFAGMSYGGTEMLGLTVAECRRPHRIMPLATKVVFFRVVVFYVGALLMLGFVVPADSPELGSVGHGAKYSPFVLAANLAQLPGLANFFNAMICIALISMANASIFASSRALQALCAKGMGPAVFGKVTPKGIPVYALVAALVLAMLAFVTAAPGGEEIFDWLLSLSAMSNYFTWASICYSHIRMRGAMKLQGHSPESLIWRSPFGLYGSYASLVVCGSGIVAQILVSVWPLGKYEIRAVVRDIIGIPFMLLLFVAYTVYQRFACGEKTLLVPLACVDLKTGLRDKNSLSITDEVVQRDITAQLEKSSSPTVMDRLRCFFKYL